MYKTQITPEGFQDLLDKQKKLLEIRPHAVSELKRARDMGDLSENGFYKGARLKLSQIDRDLRHLKNLLKSAQITKVKFDGTVQIGCTVTINDGKQDIEYKIVGTLEADPLNGKISITSPIGKKLVGRKKGDSITVTTPKGETVYTIIDVKI